MKPGSLKESLENRQLKRVYFIVTGSVTMDILLNVVFFRKLRL